MIREEPQISHTAHGREAVGGAQAWPQAHPRRRVRGAHARTRGVRQALGGRPVYERRAVAVRGLAGTG